MRSQKLFTITLTALFAFSLCGWKHYNSSAAAAPLQISEELSFKVKSDQNSYLLGELATLTFELTNKTTKNVNVGDIRRNSGGIKVFLAKQDANYKELKIPGWGRKRGTIISLAPGQSIATSATVFWQGGEANLSHLNAMAAERIRQKYVTTEYVFPEPGEYFIKAVLHGSSEEQSLESQAIKVLVNQPTGEDLIVWEKIKKSDEAKLFLQQGSLPLRDNNQSEMTKMANTIDMLEKIAAEYPDAVLSKQLSQRLAEFRKNEAERKEKERFQRMKDEYYRQWEREKKDNRSPQ